jgi:hypothetical protein
MHTCVLPYPDRAGDERTCYCGQKWKARKVKAPWKIIAAGFGEVELEWQRLGVDIDARDAYNAEHDY